MKLGELQGPFCRRKIITYARDHNTAVIKSMDLQHIGNHIYKGKNRTDRYNQSFCRLYLFYEDVNIGMDIGGLLYPDGHAVSEILAKVPPAVLQGPQAFIEYLDQKVAAGGMIPNAEILLARYIAPDKEGVYMAARQSYLDKRAAKEADERAKQAAEDAAYCEKGNAETRCKIDAALHTIRSGGKLDNERITIYHSCYDIRKYSIINHLARQYGVDIPLKVQGWINQRLTQVFIVNGRVSSYQCSGNNSKTFFKYMNQLIAAVLQQNQDGGAA